jgi:response regulator RpfG family c-di-GMP phosphodiesterase
MNKFEIHVLVAGFSEHQTQQLSSILSPLPINLHTCAIDAVIDKLPKVHVLLVGTDFQQQPNVNDDLLLESQREEVDPFDISEPAKKAPILAADDILELFVRQIKVASPYSLVYLLAQADKIESLTQSQQEQYRDFIIYPVNDLFLTKRLLRIVNDLQEKFVQLIKKRRLKHRLEHSDIESLQLKVNLNHSLKSTKQANKHLIRMLSNQVFARMGQRASGRNQQLNLLLVEIAKACDFTEPEIHDLTNAWHLRNVGKMGFSDKVLHTPYIQLSVDEQRVFNCHPTLSHAALMIVRPLDTAAKTILQHKEYLDGSGYPNGLKDSQIPMQAQVLTVINDYTELVAGRYSNRAFSTVEALTYLDKYASEK